MSKILFLHPNFPGQFKHHCKNLAAKGFEVRFLCQTHYGRDVKGVEKMVIKKRYKEPSGVLKTRALNPNNQQETCEVYKNAFNQLKEEGWEPEHIISHSGWGCGTYAKAYWPKSQLISYVEWWFNPQSEFYTYDEMNVELNINKTSAIEHWSKNQHLALELMSADCIISPTEWQRSQLPEPIKNRTLIVPDGIDLDNFNKKSVDKERLPLITYGTRGMEPVRAFKQFICEIPEILKISSDIRIEIAGHDEICYGGKYPTGFKSWGSWAKKYLHDHKVAHRVKWLGYLGNNEYIDWLKRSWCHVYLTHPYVLSWSFLEAFASGCPIVCSDVKPVTEFANDNSCVFVDHRVKSSLYYGVCSIMSDPNRWEISKQRNVSKLSQEVAFAQFLRVTGLELATKA